MLDVSEGGLCLLSPVWLKAKQQFEITIDVPGAGQSRVRAEIWHIRRQKSRGTGHRVWVAGALLVDADEAYQALLRAAGVSAAAGDDPPEREAPSVEKPEVEASEKAKRPPSRRPVVEKPKAPPAAVATEEPESNVFRIRCKARGEPRSRVLTLAAETREQAEALAIRDLGNDWSILEIREVS